MGKSPNNVGGIFEGGLFFASLLLPLVIKRQQGTWWSRCATGGLIEQFLFVQISQISRHQATNAKQDVSQIQKKAKNISCAAMTFCLTVRYLRPQQRMCCNLMWPKEERLSPIMLIMRKINSRTQRAKVASDAWRGHSLSSGSGGSSKNTWAQHLRRREARGKPGASRNFPQVAAGKYTNLNLWQTKPQTWTRYKSWQWSKNRWKYKWRRAPTSICQSRPLELRPVDRYLQRFVKSQIHIWTTPVPISIYTSHRQAG